MERASADDELLEQERKSNSNFLYKALKTLEDNQFATIEVLAGVLAGNDMTHELIKLQLMQTGTVSRALRRHEKHTKELGETSKRAVEENGALKEFMQQEVGNAIKRVKD